MAHHFETCYKVSMFKPAQRSTSVFGIELDQNKLRDLSPESESNEIGSDGQKFLDKEVDDIGILCIS